MESLPNPKDLASLIKTKSAALLSTWRTKVRQLPSTKGLDKPNLNDHIPDLLEEIVQALNWQEGPTSTVPQCDTSPPEHGKRRLQDGFEINEVVSEYNILRGCIHELAESHGLIIRGTTFHLLNRLLDEAIGLAVRTYAEQQAAEIRRRREDYLAFVAHDLRTPLGAISLAVDMLEKRLPMAGMDPQIEKTYRSLHRNVGHLNVLVNDVLEENANLQTDLGVLLECRLFDLWPLVESLLQDLQPMSITCDSKIINAVPEDLMVYADAGLLRRVLQNLLVNALRHTRHGAVTVAAFHDIEAHQVVCTVTDNGSGIAPERLKLIFERFETDSKTHRGHGLGLAICKAFIDAHGGSISVESRVDVGSTFRMTLPYAHVTTAEKSSTPVAES